MGVHKVSLQVWLPFVRDTNNQGVSSVAPNITSTYGSITSNGKLGDCFHTTSTGDLDTGYSVDLTKTSVSLCGWFKFNKAEIQAVVETKTYTSSATNATANLIGNNSYGGIGICFTTNNLYADSKVLSALNIFGALRTTTPASNYTTTTKTITFDEWIHICVVYDKEALKLFSYFNGQLYATTNITAFTEAVIRDIYINYAHIYAGNGPACAIPYYCNDLRVYNHALSAKEIKELSKGLVAHYTLADAYLESTTNLTNVQYLATSGTSTWGGHTYSKTAVSATDYPILCDTCTRVDITYSGSGGGGCGYAVHNNISATGSTTYTYSLYIKSTIGYDTRSVANILYILEYDTNSTRLKEYGVFNTSRMNPLGNGWYRCWGTFTTQTTTTKLDIRFYVYPDSDAQYYIGCWQLEQKDHMTPYVLGTRNDNTTVYDSSGYCHNGSTLGALSTSSDSARYSISTAFDGSSSGVLLENLILSPIINSDITYSFWIKPNGESGARSIYFGSYSSTSWSVEKLTNNNLRLYWNGSPDESCTGATISDGIWQHICIAKKGTNEIKVYINGVLKWTSTAAHSALTFPTTYRIGRDTRSGDGTPYKGQMSDFRIYATCLSADDIKELYQVGASIDKSGNMYAYELKEV